MNERLIELAATLEATPGTAIDSHGRSWEIERCPLEDCGGAIAPPDLDGRLAHLLTCHGWRADGRQYDNRNNLLREL